MREADKLEIRKKKDGSPKSIKITINNTPYKAKKGEWSFDAASNTILFTGDNLAGSRKAS